MKVGSLFSGVGGFDLGLERAGHEIVWQVEFDKQARSVLRRHWPDVDLYEDVCDAGESNLDGVDLICGGFPCQDVSVAGKRKGLAGERSGLWWEFHRIIGELAPAWCLIENVPGLLSSNDGRDMAVVLRGLEELGYGWAYRILDSQYFGVAQRRRRMFIVGCAGGFCPPEILLEPESVFGDSPPSRATRETTTHPTAGSLTGSGRGVERAGESRGQDPVVASSLTSSFAKNHGMAAGKDSTPHNTILAYRKAQKAHDPDDCERWEEAEYANTLNGQGDTAGVVPLAYALRSDAGRDGKAKTPSPDAEGHVRLRDPGFTVEVERSPTIDANQPHTVVTTVPRRLTPTECERLQSFPDGWTEYGAELNKKGQPFAVRLKDGPRYRMMGNAVTVDVIEWIGRRIPTPTED